MTVLTQDQALAHLNMKASAVDSTELQLYIDSVIPQIERYIGGPAENRSITEQVTPVDYFRALPLTYRQFVSLEGITAGGFDVDISDMYVTPGRIVRRKFNRVILPCWEPVIVTYTAGFGDTAPAALTLAAAIIVAHLWETQRGTNSNTGYSANSEPGNINDVAPGFGFAVPNRALELLAPYRPLTGLA